MNVGIDLGTTNSALAWIDPADAEDTSFPPIHIFDIPQLVAPGRVEPRRTLPSFLYLEEGQPVGTYAREQGAIVPTRLVHSAKSWLSNADVDRTAKILPWDAGEGGRVLSPVEVSARLLSTVREAWDKSGRFGPLAEQEVVLTVPASFDEEARELTVQAAHDAGYRQLTLLEEPAAAFYSWIANNFARSRKLLFDGQVVLICDVGGGTSDFSLIRVSRDGDKIDFTRTAVGKHLLLGGDNLDLTLAWLAETKLGKQLSIRQRSGLAPPVLGRQGNPACAIRTGKASKSTCSASGSSMIGGTLKTEITRAEALELALEGFLPLTPRGEKPKEEKRSLFRELGLPYVSDPAISRHLSAFLESAGQAPDAILFNGGFFIPEICRERVADVLENWYGKRPEIFENRDLDLAVASGAAYYSYVRSTGAGVLVRGGLPRAYYVGLDDTSAVCLVPRGAEEGDIGRSRSRRSATGREQACSLPTAQFSHAHGRQARRSSATSQQGEDIHQHAPLEAVIRFGKGGERLVPVKLGARLTETGTLETWCDSKISDNRWRLQFQLRKSCRNVQPLRADPQRWSVARPLKPPATWFAIRSRKASSRQKSSPHASKPRSAWAETRGPSMLPAVLPIASLNRSNRASRSAAHEVRWLNLGGFCLRPGFGYIGDDFRIEQVRRIYGGGPQFGNQTQNEIDWWIFWGRLAGGLNRNQQSDIVQRLLPVLLPKVGTKPQRVNNSLLREMWRTASSMELIPAANRIQLGDALVKEGKKSGFTDTFCGASRVWARASCSTARRIRCSRPPSPRDGSKRCSLSPKPTMPWFRSPARQAIRFAMSRQSRSLRCSSE